MVNLKEYTMYIGLLYVDCDYTCKISLYESIEKSIHRNEIKPTKTKRKNKYVRDRKVKKKK